MTKRTYLDPSLTLRPTCWADINAIAALVHDVAEMEGDSLFVLTAEELANECKNEGFNVERDAFVVETQDGRLVGSEEFYNESGHYQLKADGCVHPQFRGLGIGSSLLEKIEERAQAEMKLAAPNVRVTSAHQGPPPSLLRIAPRNARQPAMSRGDERLDRRYRVRVTISARGSAQIFIFSRSGT